MTRGEKGQEGQVVLYWPQLDGSDHRKDTEVRYYVLGPRYWAMTSPFKLVLDKNKKE